MKPKIYFSIFIIFLFTLSFLTSFSASKKSNAIVVFDPYVSILDKGDRFRYNIKELMPLIHQVAAQFSRIIVLLTETDLDGGLQTSRALSPLTIAEYNSLNANISNSPLEVWLAYKSILPRAEYNDDYKYHKIPFLLKHNLERLANDTKSIFNATVTTILLPYYLIRLNYQNSKQDNTSFLYWTTNPKYQWGTLFDKTQCRSTSFYTSTLIEVQFDVVIVDLLEPVNYDSPFKTIEEILHNCETHIPNKTRIGFLATISDTSTHAVANITRLVDIWQMTTSWFQKRNLEIIFSKAFDTPYEQSVEMKTSGWWRLKENASYSSSNYYIFEEKTRLAAQADRMENPKNFDWLESKIIFSKPHTGIIFSMYNDKPTEYFKMDIKVLINHIANKFSKILIYIQDPGRIGVFKVLEEIGQISELQGKMEIVVLTSLPLPAFQRVLPESLELAANRHNFNKLLFSTYIIPYMGNATFEYATYFKQVIMKNISATDYRTGFTFDTAICQNYFQMDPVNTSFINKAFNDAETIYFMFEEDEETVKLGASRMILQRIVLLEQCQRLSKTILDNEGTKDITYVLIHYPTPLTSEFYSNPWRIQNFVKYWKLLNDWVVTTNSSLILSNAIDGKRYFYERSETMTEIGWWRCDDYRTGDVMPKECLDKQHEAWQLSRKYFSRYKESQNSLQHENIVLISVLPAIIIVTIFLIVLYMVRRYYQQTKILTKSDLDEFFLGNWEDDENILYKFSYDKNRYEIDESSYSIDESQCLGSGEFGKVFQGRIFTSNEETVIVAIKTNKTKKFHKTILSGLLSEIKVLAYLGTHRNIIELIGANTKHLKNGKVLLFLEFCHLGSLKNYLRKLRPFSDDFKDTNYGENDDFTNEDGGSSRRREYVNTPAEKIVVLDAELADDLYRWSKEICEGMAYLASKHVVHADLATRNVLLNIKKEVKLCDFGLSRRMYNYKNYVKQQQEPLPWKWMSPEALNLLEFSEKSDVWSYGVTLWEIYSLGDEPYSGLSWDPKFATMLEQGLRLSEPKYNERNMNMYSVMKACWLKYPERRPTFADLQEFVLRIN